VEGLTGTGDAEYAAVLGHSSLSVTEIYTHVSLAAQREALEKIKPARIWSKSSTCSAKSPLRPG
jgi:integrase